MEGEMLIWLILALLAAALETFAVHKNIHKLELFAKPAVMVFLFIWLFASTGLQGNALWFGLGILFSLAGDIILISSSDRMFMLGLGAFLLTHVFYLIGFREQLFNVTTWSFILFFVIYLGGVRLLRLIVNSMRTKGQSGAVFPVIVYGLVISLMLFAAMSTLFDPAWKAGAALLAGIGAFLFYSSDLILAWIKFVSPINNGRVLNITTYYLGQIGLIAGIILNTLTT
jgi:alkenylglycerophosphocholine/alkenylglycerophosphoethanolamine hydrolase